MNQNLRRLAAATFTLACLQAHGQPSSVTVYGTADAGLYSRELAGESRTNHADSGLMTTSRLGFRGNEDLGGGLSAVFELSSHLRLDTGEPGRHPGDMAANRFWTRLSFVGLRGSYGLIRAGRIATGSWVNALSFSAFEESTALNPFLLHTFVGTQPMLSYRGVSDGSWSNSVAYTTPAFGGFSSVVQLAAGEGSVDGLRADATVSYRAGPFGAALSYSKIERAGFTVPRSRTDPAGAPYVIEAETGLLGSVSYDLKVVQLFGQYSAAKMQPRAQREISLDTVSLSAAVPFGPGRFIAAGARTERQQAAVSDRNRTTLSAGYDYVLSKRTDLYAVAIHDRATALDSGTGVAVGMRHHF